MVRGKKTMDICLLSGRLLLRYGAETYRVEDTMVRMAKAAGMNNVHSFVTTTGIFLSFKTEEDYDSMQMIRIKERYQDLGKVTEVNQLAREFTYGDITLDETQERLKAIKDAPMHYPLWFIYLASGMGGGAFSFLIGGSYFDMLPAFIGGTVTTITLVLIQRVLKVKFFAEFAAALTGGILALIMVNGGFGTELNQVIIGSLIPLVPGVPLTNAVRDLMSGDLVAGVARGSEALVTSLSIAAGVALSLSIFYM